MNYDKLNVVLSLSSSSYSAPTALGIREEVERIRDNVFLFNVLTVFLYFSGTFFYIYDEKCSIVLLLNFTACRAFFMLIDLLVF